MQPKKNLLILLVFFIGFTSAISAQNLKGKSVYTQKFNDSEAFFFTSDNFNVKADGKTDVSDELQRAINSLKKDHSFGILFIPEGNYLISKTIYIPSSIRLIGYGEERPLFILGKNTPGYQEPVLDDEGKANYMFWFTGGIVTPGRPVPDANAGTFYSALSNIDLKIEKGNPAAIALRTHYAQHCFVSHCNIEIGDGKAGIYDVGNEMENVKFFGGEYGIITKMPSPGWPMMMVDTYFEGQRKGAIHTRDVGFVIVNMHVKNTPVAIEIAANNNDRLFLENCLFENVEEAGVVISKEKNSANQINFKNVDCKNVPVLASFRESGRKIEREEKMYRVVSFTDGLVMDDMAAPSEHKTLIDVQPINEVPKELQPDIPGLPDMGTWVNIKELGAKGDGVTDDTEIFKKAIANHKNIYLPSGYYRLSETLKMAPNTCLIGMHPFATQFVLDENAPGFSGFGGPVPMIESSEGGNDIFNGIGVNTGGINYRAVGIKWMAGAGSLMNDVKFVGGHGTLRKPTDPPVDYSAFVGRRNQASTPLNPITAQGMDLAWDNQHWSLWVTNNGGGTLKDIWTANTYAANGLLVSNTSTPGRIYAMSLEHHVRNEARFKNVSNWKVYAFQLEEETREGPDCQPVDLIDCKDMVFANLWQFRVIKVNTRRPFGVRLMNCKNIEMNNMHSFAQAMYVTEIPVADVNKELNVFPWEMAKLTVTGNEPSKREITQKIGKINKLASGFEFAGGLTSDSKGNIYFCENRRSRIYKWSTKENILTFLTDLPWNPFSLGTDTKDNLLVVFRYDPRPGYLVNGKPETVPVLADDNSEYSSWGNSGWAAWAYSIDPNNPEETVRMLPRVKSNEIKSVTKALYPSSRWRRLDFEKAMVFTPENSFVAPDGVTIIPETYDLGRSAALSEAYPGKPVYVSDEALKRVVSLDVASDGKLSDLKEFVQRGEFSQVADDEGNLYVADGNVFVYDKTGKEMNRIELEERPVSLTLGGPDKNTLFITTGSSLFSVRVK